MANTEHTGPKTKEGVTAIQRETVKELLLAGRISRGTAEWALKQTGHTEKQLVPVLAEEALK